MSRYLSNLIFSDTLSENVKLELITQVLEEISPEMIVESLFSNSSEAEDYLFVLENLPRTGIFKDIKKAFWKRISELDEALIFEVSTKYIEAPLRQAEDNLKKAESTAKKVQDYTDKRAKKELKEPVGLAAIDRVYSMADKFNKRVETKKERLNNVKGRVEKLLASKAEHDKKVQAKANAPKVENKPAGFIKTAKDLTDKLRSTGDIKSKSAGFKDTTAKLTGALKAAGGIKNSSAGFTQTAKELANKLKSTGDIANKNIKSSSVSNEPVAPKADTNITPSPVSPAKPEGSDPVVFSGEKKAIKPKKEQVKPKVEGEGSAAEPAINKPSTKTKSKKKSSRGTGTTKTQKKATKPSASNLDTSSTTEEGTPKKAQPPLSKEAETSSETSDEKRKSDMKYRRETIKAIEELDRSLNISRDRLKYLQITPGSSKSEIEGITRRIKEGEDKRKRLQDSVDEIDKRNGKKK